MGLTTKSLHFFDSYVALDRIDTSGLTDEHIQQCLPNPNVIPLSLLPSTEDDDVIKKNLSILIGQILINNCKIFEVPFKQFLVSHIPTSMTRKCATNLKL